MKINNVPLAIGLAGLAGLAAPALAEPDKAAAAKPISIKMVDQQGRGIGTATMTPSANGVAFKLELKNLPPGSHALVLHEQGKCETPDFKSASGAAPGLVLDDITADAKGTVRTTIKLATSSARDQLIADDGSALIVHATGSATDDGTGRIACGVITGGIANK